jgi:hypothetical protein
MSSLNFPFTAAAAPAPTLQYYKRSQLFLKQKESNKRVRAILSDLNCHAIGLEKKSKKLLQFLTFLIIHIC